MPITRTASDLQRNIRDIYELCEQNDQPIYITRNGHADLVVMSANTHEKQALLRQQVYEYEMELKQRAINAYEDILADNGIPLDEALKEW